MHILFKRQTAQQWKIREDKRQDHRIYSPRSVKYFGIEKFVDIFSFIQIQFKTFLGKMASLHPTKDTASK